MNFVYFSIFSVSENLPNRILYLIEVCRWVACSYL